MGHIINLTTFKDSRGILTVLDKVVDFASENHLSITIDIGLEAEGVRFFFDFNGIIKDTEQLIEWLKAVNHSQLIVLYPLLCH